MTRNLETAFRLEGRCRSLNRANRKQKV